MSRFGHRLTYLLLAVLASHGSVSVQAQGDAACSSRVFTDFETTVLQAYVGFYGRPADPGGLTFWSGQLEASGGNLASIIESFANSQEFESRFSHLEHEALVANIYQQLFGRDLDPNGLEFWVSELDAGHRSLATIALDVLFGAQNDDATIVDNRVQLAGFYVAGIEGGSIANVYSDATLTTAMQAVGVSESSLVSACNALATGDLVNAAPTADAGIDQNIAEGGVITLDGSGNDSDGFIADFSWVQIDGQPVTLLDGDQASASFEAPEVNGDRTLIFQLTIVDDAGAAATDEIAVLVSDSDLDGFSFDRSLNPLLADAYAYDRDGPYSRVLATCAAVDAWEESCALRDLPLIGMDHDEPGVDDILSRVVVSHDWMGDRFAEILTSMPEDVLQLFKSVTSIVIDDEVRPSYYWTGTGALYLDPGYLWLTHAERDTVSDEEDYRSDFGSELRYLRVWRYVLDNDYASDYSGLEEGETYSIEDILFDVGSLLFHELAHANDFIPPAELDNLDPELTTVGNLMRLTGKGVADHLWAQSPLTSDDMHGLALVNYLGYEAFPYERRYSATQVGLFFEADVASDEYSYVSLTEDVAMLFEETMMKFHYGIDRDIAFVPVPAEDAEQSCQSLIVKWGRRNRISNSDVKTRAQLVLDEILPGRDFSLFFQELPLPTEMKVDDNWCETLAPQSSGVFSASTSLPVPGRAIHFDQRDPHARSSVRFRR